MMNAQTLSYSPKRCGFSKVYMVGKDKGKVLQVHSPITKIPETVVE